jgi:hypothetical protein
MALKTPPAALGSFKRVLGGSPGEPLCQIVLVGRPKCDGREPFVTRREVALREGHERVVLSGVERLDTEAAWVKVMIEAAVRNRASPLLSEVTCGRSWFA